MHNNIKTNLLSILFILIFLGKINAQDKEKSRFGIHATLSGGALIHYGGTLDGGISYKEGLGFRVGLEYRKPLSRQVSLETGLDISNHQFNYSYTSPVGQTIESANPEKINLLTIPLNLTMKLKNNFFFSGGLLFDFRINVIDSPKIDNQTGIGMRIRFGKEFHITERLSIFAAPLIAVHSIVPFAHDTYQHRLTEAGFCIAFVL